MCHASQFYKPIAQVDIRSGEGFCRINDIWDKECCSILSQGEYELKLRREAVASKVTLTDKLPAKANEPANNKQKQKRGKGIKALMAGWGAAAI